LQRAAALDLPPAWKIGDRKSFAAARARAFRGILGDLDLTGKEKASLAAALDHMNANERWSCFAAIKTIAREAGVAKSTVWSAIGKVDGKHILTKREKRKSGNQYASTYITLHPNYVRERGPSSFEPKQASSDKTRSQNSDLVLPALSETRSENSDKLGPRTRIRTHFTEPIEERKEDSKNGGGGKKAGKRPPRHGQRSEKNASIFIYKGTSEWDSYAADFEEVHGRKKQPASKYGNVGSWFKIAGAR
jgi:hypothetical protein